MKTRSRERGVTQRLKQLERGLAVQELLAPLRHGATVPDLQHEPEIVLGVRYHPRTVSRDLFALAHLKLVERIRAREQPRPNGRVLAAWRFRSGTVRAAVIKQAAELRDCG